MKIELWRPRTLGGWLVFTRLTVFYQKSLPRGHGRPRHYTFTDTYARGGYGWGPPGEQGYCVHTYGQKPAVGCGNIHSLPPGGGRPRGSANLPDGRQCPKVAQDHRFGKGAGG